MRVPTDPLEQSLLQTIERHQLLQAGQTVVVAVSGGPDSVCLLLGLAALSSRLDIQLEVAHVNHLLRGKESDEDEEFVRILAGRLSLPLHAARIETAQAASDKKENLEAYARQIRYDFLFQIAVASGAVVATAHSLNDLVETFLLKLFRGAGLSGLVGIYPRRVNRGATGHEIVVVRPLIDTTRSQILAYLAAKGQSFRQDSSNVDLSFDRNLVRQRLIPMLETQFNPDVTHTLGRTAVLLREVEEYLDPAIEAAFNECREPGASAVTLSFRCLENLAGFLQGEVVRRAIKQQKGDLKDISYRHVADILSLNHSGRECHLPDDLVVRREFDRLVFDRRHQSSSFAYELPVPGDVYITEVGKLVHIRRLERTESAGGIPVNLPTVPLRLRNRRPGDRYRLTARGQPRKLKEILIEKKVPRSLRDQLLIIEDGREILWVEGLPPSPRLLVASSDCQAFAIEVEHETFRPLRLLNQ